MNITDDDKGEITAWHDGKPMRGWSYDNAHEQKFKMIYAREYANGWIEATQYQARPDLHGMSFRDYASVKFMAAMAFYIFEDARAKGEEAEIAAALLARVSFKMGDEMVKARNGVTK